MAEAKAEGQEQAPEAIDPGEFEGLLKKEFRPKSDRAKAQVETAVQTLARQVLDDKDLIAEDAVNSINAIIAEIDTKLTEQMNYSSHRPG